LSMANVPALLQTQVQSTRFHMQLKTTA